MSSEVARAIVTCCIFLFDAVGTTVLIWYFIHKARKASIAEHDVGAEDRAALREGQRTLIERIEHLKERPTNQTVMLFNGDRHAVLGVWRAQLDKDGLPNPSQPPDMAKMKKNRGARVVMIAVETGLGSFLEGLKT